MARALYGDRIAACRLRSSASHGTARRPFNAAPPPPLARIREALHSPSTNPYNERGDDVGALLTDGGDLALAVDAAEARAAIEDRRAADRRSR